LNHWSFNPNASGISRTRRSFGHSLQSPPWESRSFNSFPDSNGRRPNCFRTNATPLWWHTKRSSRTHERLKGRTTKKTFKLPKNA